MSLFTGAKPMKFGILALGVLFLSACGDIKID
jgi:hypothetical protein